MRTGLGADTIVHAYARELTIPKIDPRSILITGATSGIGRALALEYAEPGVFLALSGRRRNRLEETATLCRDSGSEVSIAALDVRDRKSMAGWIRDVDEVHPIDLAIPNAGITIGVSNDSWLEDAEAARTVIDINLSGTLNTVEPVIDAMYRRKKGQVALMGSMGALRTLPHAVAYSLSKGAIHAYADALRLGLRENGITCSLIMPGFVATELNERILCPKPMLMSADAAARRIRRGLSKGKRVIAFPRTLYLGATLFAALPRALTDSIFARIDVEIPPARPEDLLIKRPLR